MKLRVIHIGHSIHHNAGAAAAKIDSVLITGDGVHKEELMDTRKIQQETFRSCDALDYSTSDVFDGTSSTISNNEAEKGEILSQEGEKDEKEGVSTIQQQLPLEISLLSKVCNLCD